MTAVKFGTEEKVAITQKLQRYLADELALEIGQFDAEFFFGLYIQGIGLLFLQPWTLRCSNGFKRTC
jgi:uncharacterized protein (DUF2164 family)